MEWSDHNYLPLFLEPIITEGGDTLLMFRGKEERFYIPGQEIQGKHSEAYILTQYYLKRSI